MQWRYGRRYLTSKVVWIKTIRWACSLVVRPGTAPVSSSFNNRSTRSREKPSSSSSYLESQVWDQSCTPDAWEILTIEHRWYQRGLNIVCDSPLPIITVKTQQDDVSSHPLSSLRASVVYDRGGMAWLSRSRHAVHASLSYPSRISRWPPSHILTFL